MTTQSRRTVGQIEVERDLGRGGMGVVRLGRQPGLDRLVVLKTLRRDYSQTELPINEIAALCGFLRPEPFSRAYAKRFEIAPIRDRIEGRIPFELRNLSNDYYHNHIGFDEYRIQRRLILDKIDQEMNGKTLPEQSRDDAQQDSIFMQTIGFMKNADLDE